VHVTDAPIEKLLGGEDGGVAGGPEDLGQLARKGREGIFVAGIRSLEISKSMVMGNAV
jgi:hypothetical protein